MTRSFKLTAVMIAGALIAAVSCNRPNQDVAKQMVPVSSVEEPGAAGRVNPRSAATALQFGEGMGEANGVVTFTETGQGVKVSTQVSGLQPGVYSLHLHENGECTGPDFATVGERFNPHGQALAEGEQSPEHVAGDLGEIDVGQDGSGSLETESKVFTVTPGPASVVGRSVVLDAGRTGEERSSGAVPAHTACGVVLEESPPAPMGGTDATQQPQ